MEVENLLMEEIREEFIALKSIEVGSKEFETAVNGLSKLNEQVIEIQKLKNDKELKDKQHELDVEKSKYEQSLKKKQQIIDANQKTNQLNEEKSNNRVKNGIAVAGIVTTTCLTVWGTFKSFKFEETGTITTIMGRGFVQRLLGKK